MLKFPQLLFLFGPLLLVVSPLSARVGESQSDLESRLDESGRGLHITDGDLIDYHRNRSPIGPYAELIPETEYEVYYKINTTVIPTSRNLWHADAKGKRSGKPIDRPEGWLLHVLYLNGVSVFEYYQRSQGLTSVEKNGILSINKGESEWEQGRVPKDNEDAIQPQIFRHNHYRADFSIYANVSRDSILLFDPRLDQMIKERELDKAMELAPDSLDGF